MKLSRLSVVAVLLIIALELSSARAATDQTTSDNRAITLVRLAIEKVGGEEKLRALKSVQLEKIGHTYLVEQSERPEGPWIVNYEQISELRDFANQRLRRTTQSRNIQAPQWSNGLVLKVAGGVAALQFGERLGPARGTDLAEAEETLELSFERALLIALEAKDLHVEPDRSLQGTAQHAVAFGWRDGIARLYLNVQTGMPTAIELDRAYPGSMMWASWGDVRTRTYLSLWTIEPGGLRYPRQWDVERNGVSYQSFTVVSLTLNPNIDNDAFAINDNVKNAFQAAARRTIEETPLGQANKPAVELAPGVVHIPGLWNVTLVRQQDGVVVIEAPISSGYSDKVIGEAKKRFPDLPIKAVISTSDAWPHIGGVREYVARDIPVFALDLNRPILERLIAAPRRVYPDALQRQPKKAKFKIVSAKTLIGSGPNRLELYPIRTETGERMIMVFFPGHKLLYGSDLVQQQRDGSFFMPEYLAELIDATARENITAQSVFAMHTGLTPWKVITDAVPH